MNMKHGLINLSLKTRLVLYVCSICFFLSFIGCAASNSDIRNFIAQTKARKPKPVQSLPEFKQIPPNKFTAANLRNPFLPYVESQAVKPTVTPQVSGPGPNLNRQKEVLEQFPLDALRMVGTIARNNNMFALIKAPDGIIHLVGVGNYMGLNYGKIQSINETTIEIREWINVKGQYSQRTVEMHLTP